MRAKLLDGLAPIRCLGHQSHIGLRTDKYRYALPYENMIVNGKNPDLSKISLTLYRFLLICICRGPLAKMPEGPRGFYVRSPSWNSELDFRTTVRFSPDR